MKKFLYFFIVLLCGSYAFAVDSVCSKGATRDALVVIDMQSYFVKRSPNYKDPKNVHKVEEVLAAQVAAIKKAEKHNTPIIFIEYEMDENESTSSTLMDAVKNYPDVKVFKKTSDGMFDGDNNYRTDLVNYLQKNDIKTLVITGANGGACVAASIYGALLGNCNVVAYNKGIADFNYDNFIYPYAGYYAKLTAPCSSCSFHEVSSLKDIVNTTESASSSGEHLPTDTRRGAR